MGREGASEARALGRRRRAIFRSASQISWARAKILYRRVVNLGMLNEEAGKGGGGGGTVRQAVVSNRAKRDIVFWRWAEITGRVVSWTIGRREGRCNPGKGRASSFG